MNGKRLVYASLVCLVIFTSGPQPAALAHPAIFASTTDTNPQPGNRFFSQPNSVPGPLSGPKPTINVNVNHGYIGQEIIVTGVVPSPIYTKVRIALLFNDTTYTAALVNTTNLSYASTIKIPLTKLTGQAQVCAALTNEPAAEFACTAFTLDTPPPGSVSGSLPTGSLPVRAHASIAAPTPSSTFINLTDRAGTVVYSSTVALDGSFSIGAVTPGIYGYAFSGDLSGGVSAGKMIVEPGKDSKLKPFALASGFDPVTGTPCIGKFDAQVSMVNASTSDSSFGYFGGYSTLSSFTDLFDSVYGTIGMIAGKDYDFGMYLQGVSLPVTFHSHLTKGTGVTVDHVEYHVQKPDHSIVALGSSFTAGDYYSLLHNVMDLPVGRSKLLVAPVVDGVRQCPTTFSIQVDVDPMKDPRVQAGATTTWNSTKNWYDFQGTLISAGGLLPFKYPDPVPDLPLLGPLENSFNAGLHVEGDIRLSGLVHIKIARALANAKIFNQSILDKSQELIDDSVAHIYTDTHDWRKTKVVFVPVKLWEDSFSTTVYKGPLASFWGIVTINASLSVGLDGSVTIEGTIYPFQPNLDATLRNKVTPSLTVSIWVDILLGVASAGADGKVAVSFLMPLRLNTDDPDHPDWVWMDTPCFSVKITLSAWARVNLLFWKHTWNIGSYELVNYSNPSGCTALARAVKQVAPEAVLMPPRVMASPAVASNASGEMLSAYVVDASPAITQTTPTVMASFFDTNLQLWETAMPVSDGLHNVQDPAVGFIGQSQTPIVVWTQTDLTLAQENLAGDDINSYLNKQEIYYRLWNDNSNSWDPAVRLTNDSLPDGRAAIGGDLTGATLAWTVNISGVVTATQSLRIKVTDWDSQNGTWGTISTLNGNGLNPALNAQVSVARNSAFNLKTLAWTVDTDGNSNTNGDRGILACREAATWPTATCDTMGSLPAGSGAESPSLSIDPTTGLLHLAFLVRGKDGDGTSDTGIGNRAMLYSGQANGAGVWSYQALTDHGSPIFAEKPVMLISSSGDESLVFRRFGAAGTNGLLGQLTLIHKPAGGNFSNPSYLTDDGSQHYQLAGAASSGSPSLMLLSVNRGAITPGLAPLPLTASGANVAQSPRLAPAAKYHFSQQSTQTLATAGDPVESLALNNQADLALDPTPDISLPHALQGTTVAITLTLRNLGLGVAISNNPPIEVCLHNGVPPNGNQLGCQDLPANINTLNFNDETQFVFTATRTSGLQPFFARVDSNGYNGLPANDIVTGTLGDIPAPLLTGVFADGSLPNAMDVQWMPPGVPGLGGYRLLRSKTPGGPYELVGETSDTYLPDLMLKLGQTYCYVVQAYDGTGILSPNSSEGCGMLPLLNFYMPVIRR